MDAAGAGISVMSEGVMAFEVFYRTLIEVPFLMLLISV